jgi:hypothetical protein
VARKYTPKPEEIPSGICECGCGEPTPLAPRTFTQWRWFSGHPKPYIKGHHAKNNHLSNRGVDHPRWKGGRVYRRGYVMLYLPDHPGADSKGYVAEHRVVCEQRMGRPLRSEEHVHHINGIKDDNAPENLVVLTARDHQLAHLDRTLRNFKAATLADPERHSKAGRKGAEARWRQ